jgi:DNA mismatch endonuclease (patch repair protein)
MRCVHSTDTTPERKIRTLLHKLGYRFRIHRLDLPGKPDIVLPKYHAVVFVQGCFWHRHAGCSRATTPASRQEYWVPKFQRTVNRDWKNQEELRQHGWNVIVIWECETKDSQKLAAQLSRLINQYPPTAQKLSPIAIAAEKRKNYKHVGLMEGIPPEDL